MKFLKGKIVVMSFSWMLFESKICMTGSQQVVQFPNQINIISLTILVCANFETNQGAPHLVMSIGWLVYTKLVFLHAL